LDFSRGGFVHERVPMFGWSEEAGSEAMQLVLRLKSPPISRAKTVFSLVSLQSAQAQQIQPILFAME